jgi:hypothetical protein
MFPLEAYMKAWMRYWNYWLVQNAETLARLYGKK